MTVQDLIEKLMGYPLDAEVVFAEMRYTGGSDEYFDGFELDIWRSRGGDVYLTPSVDTEYVKQRQ